MIWHQFYGTLLGWLTLSMCLLFSFAAPINTNVSDNEASAINIFADAQRGSDTNTGLSQSSPVATLDAAQRIARVQRASHALDVNVTVNLRGVFRITSPFRLDMSDSGVYWNGDHSAVISGGVPIKQWSESTTTKGLWRAPAPASYFKQLFVEAAPGATTTTQPVSSTRLTRARTPNLGSYHTWVSPIVPIDRQDPNDPVNKRDKYGFVFAPSDVPDSPANSKFVEFVVFHGWTTSRHHLNHVISTNNTVTFTNPSDRPIGYWGNVHSEGGGRYYIDGLLEGLDAPGEWYLDWENDQVLYIARSSTEDPNDLIFTAPQVVGELFILDNVTDVFVSGISFAYQDYSCGPVEQCDRQSTEWQTTSALYITSSTNVTLSDISIHSVGDYAIHFDGGSTHCTLRDSTVSNLGTGGVWVGGTNPSNKVSFITVVDNVITDGGWVFPSGTGVFLQYASNCIVSHNEVSHLAYTGISVGWSWNFNETAAGAHIISFNHIHSLGAGVLRQLGDAMACVYTLGKNYGTVVDNNLCHDVQAYFTGGYCLSQDQGSSDITFTNNICFRTTASSQNQHYGANIVYRNNIFADGSYLSATPANPAALRTSPQVELPNSVTFDTNIVYESNASAVLFEGDFNISQSTLWEYSFRNNLYYYTSVLASDMRFGGCSLRMCRTHAFNYTLTEWKGLPYVDGDMVDDPLFLHADRYVSLDFTLSDNSPAVSSLGFQQIDTTNIGPRR